MKPDIEKLRGHTILLTGASGFLGSNLLQRLRTVDAKVIAVSRRRMNSGDESVLTISADLSSLETVKRIFLDTQPDFVFHLVGYGTGAPGIEHVIPSFTSDLMSAINILIMATECKAQRLVLTRSLEEPDDDPASVPGTPYAATKYAVSIYARMFHKLYRTPVVMVRPFMTYGPGQKSHKVVPYVISSLLRGEVPKLGSGERLVDWVYVDDVIDGLLKSAIRPEIEGMTFDLGSGHLVSIRHVVTKISELVDSVARPHFDSSLNRPVERVRAANTELTFQKLGWRASTSLTDGLSRTVACYREQISKSLMSQAATLQQR